MKTEALRVKLKFCDLASDKFEAATDAFTLLCLASSNESCLLVVQVPYSWPSMKCDCLMVYICCSRCGFGMYSPNFFTTSFFQACRQFKRLRCSILNFSNIIERVIKFKVNCQKAFKNSIFCSRALMQSSSTSPETSCPEQSTDVLSSLDLACNSSQRARSIICCTSD